MFANAPDMLAARKPYGWSGAARRMLFHLACAWWCAALAESRGLPSGGWAAAEALAPWSENQHPGDVARRHEEIITAAEQVYVVHQDGTLDGRSCRSPMGVYEGWTQVWESNRSVRLENLGDTDVVNPWLSNGSNLFRTPQEIIASAVRPGMSDREKALAIYSQQIARRHHWHGDNDELGDPVKIFNVYGYNTCGNDSICLAGLWTRAGLKAVGACVVGHCISQVYFDGRWNLLDGDTQGLYLLRDGYTIAGEFDLARDHDLVKRTHTLGPLRRADQRGDEFQAALFVLDQGERNPRDSAARHTMNLTLRPGEALVWRWGHRTPARVHGRDGVKYPHTVSNGLWEYRPDFGGPLWQLGADQIAGVRTTEDGLAGDVGRTGIIQWSMRCPYPFVGGQLEVDGEDTAFEVSFDGNSWRPAGPDLDALFDPGGPARYAYQLRCTLAGGARLRGLCIRNDLQMAPLSLPEMVVGSNRFTYTDASAGPRRVRITHEWVERSTTRPPAAAAAPRTPPPGGKSDGTQIVFSWTPATDPDGDRIADYHLQLSDRADFAYPLSSNFNRLVSRTTDGHPNHSGPDRGDPHRGDRRGGSPDRDIRARFSLPRAGLLAPGRKYYWRVRAQDEHGVWGAWSDAWSFEATGPAPPLSPRLDQVEDGGNGVLRWAANPAGSPPVKYRVYGSDEKGFTISDEPYATLGTGQERWPSNFVAEVTGTELAVLGRGVSLPNANRAYYRVVAIDGLGHASAESDFAESPRPFIFTPPPPAAQVGREFRHMVTSIRSLGDVRARDSSKLDTRYWDAESAVYAIEEGPPWLMINPQTGELTGVPTQPGKVRLRVSARLVVEERRLDVKALAWGIEKVVGTARKSLGTALDEYWLDVDPAVR